MANIQAPVSAVILDLIRSHLTDETPEVLSIIEKLLEHFDAAGWVVDHFDLTPVAEGTRAEVVIDSWANEVEIGFPQFPYAKAFFAGQGAATGPLTLHFILGTDPDSGALYVELEEITFGLRIKNLLDPNSGGNIAEFSRTKGFRLYPGLGFEWMDFSAIELPELKLGSSIGFKPKGLEFDLSKSSAIAPIAGMGLSNAFIGLYLRELELDIPVDTFFSGFPGLNLNFFDLALGTTGVSFQLLELFDAQNCLDNGGGGHLVNSDWKFCPHSYELKMLDSRFDLFNIRGVLNMPLIEAPLDFSFEFDHDLANEGLSIAFIIEKNDDQQIDLGNDLPFDIPVKNLKIEGKIVKTAGNLVIEHASIQSDDLGGAQISLENASITSDGFSGTLKGAFPLSFNPATDPKFAGPLVVDLGAFEFGLSEFSLTFENNAPANGTSVKGQLYVPVFKDPLTLGIGIDTNGELTYTVEGFDDFFFDEGCAAFRWTASSLSDLMNLLAPGQFNNFSGQNVETILKVNWQGTNIQEIRADIKLDNQAQTFEFPGIEITTPNAFTLHVILKNSSSNGQLPHIVNLAATLGTGQGFKGQTNFAWMRDGLREVNNDNQRIEQNKKPLIQFNLDAQKAVSLALMRFDLKEKAFPSFFKQYSTALGTLEIPPAGAIDPPICDLTTVDVESLSGDSFTASMQFNPDGLTDYFLPFLKNDEANEQANLLDQFLSIKLKEDKISADFNQHLIKCPLDLNLKIGKLNFGTGIELGFNWEDFAFHIDHNGGIDLILNSAELTQTDFLGLDWSFKGKDLGGGRFHYFTLVTQNYHYQVKQAEGSVVEISYTKISKEPIVFAISDFVLSPKGINLTAEVTDRPARLNGINTRFTFNGTRFQIKENRIQEFTLSGSGPLPPDLVGDATVDIALQFKQIDGNLTLHSGGAKLQTNKLLEAKNIRFQFRIDAIGLQFVNDGNFHLYFTLTGSARFVPIASDDPNGPLALLSKIGIDFIDCPLTGDVSVLAKHIKFLVELPKTISFSFLGCFEMELRGIGFIPEAEAFDGDAAIALSGQVYFSAGKNDVVSTKIDFHNLYIGIPRKGSFIPRVSLEKLALEIAVEGAFRLQGVVSFVDTALQSGFMGEGMIEIRGLPSIAAAFAFLRVRREPEEGWLRAWFIYLEIRRISLEIPVIKLFIREIGLGFGYRYTITSIKVADQTDDIRSLLKELKKLSLTQGNLARLDNWAVDIEEKGADPRWTIVLRAMISQTSVSGPLSYNESGEKTLACVFLFDALIAFRSDFTFYMGVRAWLNTNYNDFLTDAGGAQTKPLFSGFILLSPRKKRLLANLSSSQQGGVGDHPPLPDFIKQAISSVEFSVVLLIEPGLFHYEMGWPDRLGYKLEIGPLTAEVRAGFIFRISTREIVIGQSLIARGRLEIDYGIDFGFIGARIYALAEVAWGARYIGVLGLQSLSESALYGVIGLEIKITFSVSFWFKIDFGFFTVKFSFSFSFHIGFTASLEVGLNGTAPGVRGQGTISIGAMGHSIRLNVKVGIGEDNVNAARAKTEKFLNIGLEATDVEPIPGVPSGNIAARISAAPGGGSGGNSAARSMAMAARAARMPVVMTISQPDYSIFIIREKIGDHFYFVLLPAGKKQNGEAETGFLPIPPDANVVVTEDFSITLPETPAGFQLEQFDPLASANHPSGVTGTFAGRNTQQFGWRVNWDQRILETSEVEPKDDASNANVDQVGILRNYLKTAFAYAGDPANLQYFDPPALPGDTLRVDDQRVYNPTDSAYESAVRGAVEQFRGSPLFKQDPTVEYDRLLSVAFSNQTNIYADPDDNSPEAAAARSIREQTDQFRGLIVHDLVASLQQYARHMRTQDDPANAEEYPAFLNRSVAFQMGLVFRLSGDELPAWLDFVASDVDKVKIRQRSGQTATSADGEARAAQTFNVSAVDFSVNPPQFQRIQHFTDANMIAITWDLVWEEIPNALLSAAQNDPEQHLQHYKVRRRTIDNSEPELVYTIKNAEVLVVEDSLLKSLQPRFKIVDHFNHETLEQQAALPEEGRTYLYTITPVDFSEQPGRPLTLLATRFPNLPPAAPVESSFVVTYKLDDSLLAPDAAASPANPELIPQEAVSVSIKWLEPKPGVNSAPVPIDEYRLIFRPETTIPTGSYGADASTTEPRHKNLPTSNARPAPTDLKLDIRKNLILQDPDASGNTRARMADIPLADLQAAGIFPAGANAPWKPEAWRVFFQTESVNGVPSSLVPVTIVLRVEPAGTNSAGQGEDRIPGHLEWLPRPLRFELLPPVDMRAIDGMAHLPMLRMEDPKSLLNYLFSLGEGDDNLAGVQHSPHPDSIRAIRFFWNQGPSGQANYPLQLNAGYDLLQLDTDAFSTETFADKDELAEAVKKIQEVRMAPADELFLIPADTLSTSQWEAWYAGTAFRRRVNNNVEGSETPFGAWFSWRDSMLEWPARAANVVETDAGNKPVFVHPYLSGILKYLENVPEDGGTLPKYVIDRQILPPMQPIDEQQFLTATAPGPDPYGWGILQRMGLTITFSIRIAKTGDLVTGQDMLELVRNAIAVQSGLETETIRATFSPGLNVVECAELLKFLHVEMLFQQGKSIELDVQPATADKLLGIIQLSLRPNVRQTYRYAQLSLTGPAGKGMGIRVEGTDACTVVNLDADGRPEASLVAGTGGVLEGGIALSANSQTRLLVRCRESAGVVKLVLKIVLKADLNDTAGISGLSIDPVDKKIIYLTLDDLFNNANAIELKNLENLLSPDDKVLASVVLDPDGAYFPNDDRSSYFTVPPELAGRFAQNGSTDRNQWILFKQYAEMANSSDPTLPRINIPVDGKALEDFLPLYWVWSQRFHNHSAFVSMATNLGQVAGGPWIAVAYPKAGTPAFSAPDKSGRIKYDHLVEDQWAHNFRYYIRPYGRYDLLWESFRQSVALMRGLQTVQLLKKATPEPDSLIASENVGGLDVVLDRIRPVQKPLVLFSGRLDEESKPSKPVEPGSTWEVIIAQHPEQALLEKNQTLYRRLSFRQVAFTLLRRFHSLMLNDPGSFKQINDSLNPSTPVQFDFDYVENIYPEIPGELPAEPDHTDLNILSKNEALALSIPKRIGRFSQNATVLQWEGLPFFYEQQLLAVAQTSQLNSGITSVTQQDFHYQSPRPEAILGLFTKSFVHKQPDNINEEESPYILIAVQRLWDALSPRAQAAWPAEAPETAPEGKWRLSAIPDLEAVYQVVEIYSGNIEVQSEFFFNKPVAATNTAASVERRRLGKRFEMQDVFFMRPATDPRTDFFYLAVPFDNPGIEVEVRRDYNDIAVFGATAARTSFAPYTNPPADEAIGMLRVKGYISPEDVDNILWNSVSFLNSIKAQELPNPNTPTAAERHAFLDTWYSTMKLGSPLQTANLPLFLLDKLEFPNMVTAVPGLLRDKLGLSGNMLSWTGAASRMDQQLLLAFAQSQPDGPFRSALESLHQRLQQDHIFVTMYTPLGNPFPNASVPPQLSIAIIKEDTNTLWQLSWTGPMTAADFAQLQALDSSPEWTSNVESLFSQINDEITTLAIPDGTPTETPSGAPAPFSMDQEEIQPGEFQRILRWQGSIDISQKAALEALDGDAAFKDGIQLLFGKIEQTMAQATAFEVFHFSWPLFDFELLSAQTGVDFSEMFLSTENKLDWTRPQFFEQDTAQIMARVKAVLNPNDPLIPALEALLTQVDAQVTEQSFELIHYQVRVRKPLTKMERDILIEHNQNVESSIRALYDDLFDKYQLIKTSDSSRYEVFVSAAPDVAAIPGLYLTPASKTNLVLYGLDSSGIAALQADEAFNNGILDLLDAVNARTFSEPFDFKASGLLRQQILALGLEVDETAGFFTNLRWKGAMTPAQRDALLALNEPPELRQAIALLVQQTDHAVTKQPIQADISILPEGLKNKLHLDEQNNTYTQIRWDGVLSGPELDSLRAWAQGLSELENAVENLADTLEAASTASAPLAPFVPPAIQQQIQLTAGQIAWFDPTQTAAAHIDTWKNDANTPAALQTALQSLLNQFAAAPDLDIVHAVIDPAISLRPTAADLPAAIQNHLLFGTDSIRWTGWINTAEQLALLNELKTTGDAAFRTAIEQLLAELDAAETTVVLAAAVPKRPGLADIPAALQERFIVGANALACYGALGVATARNALELFDVPAERRAVQELYDCSQLQLIRQRDIRIRSRRGGAKPSDMLPFTFINLAQ